MQSWVTLSFSKPCRMAQSHRNPRAKTKCFGTDGVYTGGDAKADFRQHDICGRVNDAIYSSGGANLRAPAGGEVLH